MTKLKNLLDADAPDNTYRIDAVIHELLDEYQPLDRREILRFSRTAIDTAGAMAVEEARYRLLDHPKHREAAKKFCADLEQLEAVLRRLHSQDPDALVGVLPAPAISSTEDPVRDLKDSARASYLDILELQERCGEFQAFVVGARLRWKEIAPAQPPNADPLAHWFIQGGVMFRDALVAEYGVDMPRRFLVRWLAAGWEDLGFPCDDSKGEARGVLESWISARLNTIFAHTK